MEGWVRADPGEMMHRLHTQQVVEDLSGAAYTLSGETSPRGSHTCERVWKNQGRHDDRAKTDIIIIDTTFYKLRPIKSPCFFLPLRCFFVKYFSRISSFQFAAGFYS